MPKAKPSPDIKVGDTVETVHGESIVVKAVEQVPVRKRGVPTGETQARVLAESGGHDTWFPLANIK